MSSRQPDSFKVQCQTTGGWRYASKRVGPNWKLQLSTRVLSAGWRHIRRLPLKRRLHHRTVEELVSRTVRAARPHDQCQSPCQCHSPKQTTNTRHSEVASTNSRHGWHRQAATVTTIPQTNTAMREKHTKKNREKTDHQTNAQLGFTITRYGPAKAPDWSVWGYQPPLAASKRASE